MNSLMPLPLQTRIAMEKILKLNKELLKTLQPELPACIIFCSFLPFWLRAIEFKLNSFNLASLYVGLLINLPLVLAFSANGLQFLKKLVAKRYGFALIGFYILFTTFHFSTLVAASCLRVIGLYLPYPYQQMVMALMAYHPCFPLFALVLSYILFKNKADSGIDWKVILFLAIVLSLDKIEIWLINNYFNESIIASCRQLLLLAFKKEGSCAYLGLMIWRKLIPILLVFASSVSHKDINFGKKWDRRTTRISLYFAAFILFRFLGAFYIGRATLETSSWLWKLATGFYFEVFKIALLEEVIFRGILQTYLSSKLNNLRFGEMASIFLSALLFGIWHFPFIMTPWYRAAIDGAIFGWAYSKTKNIWVPVGLHALYNFLIGNIIIFHVP
jgi:membrane protease YdiL (CAAX protease family)